MPICRARRWGIVRAAMASAVLAGLAGACSSAGDDPAAAQAASASDQQTGEAQPSQSQDPTAQMVRAVSGAKHGPPVDLKFELMTHPQVGEPADIRIAIIPVSPRIEWLQASFRTLEGMKIVAGAELERVSRPPAEVPIEHTVTIQPGRDGIFHVTAIVTVEEPGASLSRSFSIPVIAGAGLQVPGARAATDERTAAAPEPPPAP